MGSYETITNYKGDIVEKLSFDPWGRKRNPIDWTYTPSPFDNIFDRGYTGHEHIYEFGIINMNGRLYDPWLGRMLSPDPYVQAPTYSQNFNRYSYAFNNPLKYSDPDGEWVNIVVGAAIGGTINWAIHGGEFTWDGLKYFGIGAAAGALAAGVGAGVGAALAGNAAVGGGFAAGFTGTATISSSGFAAGAVSGAAGGITNGLISGTGNGMMSGMNFGDAFIKGGLDQALWQGLGGAAFGGIMGTLDAISSREHWLTGSTAKTYRITDGEDVISRDAANTAVAKNKGTRQLAKRSDSYSIEIEAPKGWEMTSGYATGPTDTYPLISVTDYNTQIVEFPMGTIDGGYYGAQIQRAMPIRNTFWNTELFSPNERKFSTLFWYLSLIH